ncbi:hypothetical protein OPT61_g4271 [Boeremia exigua]|uniref:Uncharacterized protein n=1 Tax=Boeremia exigua TaxID=749465 RepID=A0ACC2IEW4_9PLEO|nr:hypothetical protein OPT61_g4271 [Boeremia exigua]
MAVLSTLQSIPTEVDTATMHLTQFVEAQDSFSNDQDLYPRSGTPDIVTVTGSAHGSFSSISDFPKDSTTNASSFGMTNNQMDHEHGGALVDGETVWFCSECGNGPMGTWYTACPCCNHGYCGYCRVEQH